MKMINSRLYYDIKEFAPGILKFHYYTDEISADFSDLKSYTKQINQQEILPALNNISIKEMLYSINEVEFSRLFEEVEKYKDYVNELACIEPIEANIASAKLWGPNELQRKFIEWFKINGYSIPNGN